MSRPGKMLAVATIALSGLLAAACGSSGSAASGSPSGSPSSRTHGTHQSSSSSGADRSKDLDFHGETIVVNSFGGSSADIWKKTVIEPFEKKYNAKVNTVPLLSAQMYQKLAAQKANPQFDVWKMTGAPISRAISAGLTQPLDQSIVTNLNNLISGSTPQGNKYAAVYFPSLALVYNKNNVKNPPEHWSDLWDPQYKGKVALPSAASSAAADAFLMLISHLNGSKSITDVEPGLSILKKNRTQVLTYYTEQAKMGQLISSGQADIGVWWSDRAWPAQDSGAPVGVVCPTEGTAILGAGMGIVNGTKHAKLANLYVNFSLAAEQASANSTQTLDLPSNKNVKLPSDVQTKLPHGQCLDNAIAPDPAKFGSHLSDWTEKLQAIQSAG